MKKLTNEDIRSEIREVLHESAASKRLLTEAPAQAATQLSQILGLKTPQEQKIALTTCIRLRKVMWHQYRNYNNKVRFGRGAKLCKDPFGLEVFCDVPSETRRKTAKLYLQQLKIALPRDIRALHKKMLSNQEDIEKKYFGSREKNYTDGLVQKKFPWWTPYSKYLSDSTEYNRSKSKYAVFGARRSAYEEQMDEEGRDKHRGTGGPLWPDNLPDKAVLVFDLPSPMADDGYARPVPDWYLDEQTNPGSGEDHRDIEPFIEDYKAEAYSKESIQTEENEEYDKGVREIFETYSVDWEMGPLDAEELEEFKDIPGAWDAFFKGDMKDLIPKKYLRGLMEAYDYILIEDKSARDVDNDYEANYKLDRADAVHLKYTALGVLKYDIGQVHASFASLGAHIYDTTPTWASAPHGGFTDKVSAGLANIGRIFTGGPDREETIEIIQTIVNNIEVSIGIALIHALDELIEGGGLVTPKKKVTELLKEKAKVRKEQIREIMMSHPLILPSANEQPLDTIAPAIWLTTSLIRLPPLVVGVQIAALAIPIAMINGSMEAYRALPD